jgi:putative acetyltransferase
MQIGIERADAPGVRELLEASDEFHNALYPPEDNFLLDVAALLAPEVTVVVARDAATAVAMGALVDHGDSTAELKRMFTVPASRGSGIAGLVLDALEEVARARGIALVQLETGPLQPAAISFYEGRGYLPTEAFGDYLDATNAVFFAKALASGV